MATKKKTSAKKKNAKKKEQMTPKAKKIEVFLMLEQEVTATKIAETYDNQTEIICDVWSELNIFELEYAKGMVADFEPIDMQETFEGSFDQEFIHQHNIKTVYITSYDENLAKEFYHACNPMLEAMGGFICADSDDFQPMYRV